MAFLNFYLGRLAYSDGCPQQNPKQKNFEFLTSREGLAITSPSSSVKEILPGQTVLLESTARTIGSGLSTSQFVISHPISTSDISRLRWTGTGPSPAFRTLRAINYGSSPATTTYEAERLTATAIKITLTGAAVDLSPALVGDELYLQASDDTFSSPLNATSLGQRYQILASTANSVTVRDSGNIAEETGIVLGSDYETVLRIFSSSGVQVGDKIRIAAASNFNEENKNKDFEVIEVSDRDVIFYNPLSIPETVTSGVASPFSVYDRLINFLVVESTGSVSLKFNGGVEELPLQLVGETAVFASTLSAFSVAAVNNTNASVTVRVQSCSI